MKISDSSGNTVVLDDFQILQVTLNKLRKVYDWESSYYIDTASNKVMKSVTYQTTHSWDEEIEVREATADDYRFAAICSKLLCHRR